VNGIDPSRIMQMRAQILERNDALQRAAGLGLDGQVGGATGAAGRVGFGDALQGALRQVNEMQAQSSAITEAYERGQTTDRRGDACAPAGVDRLRGDAAGQEPPAQRLQRHHEHAGVT
jgi:flagellar hook-basal body complex protein FliE